MKPIARVAGILLLIAGAGLAQCTAPNAPPTSSLHYIVTAMGSGETNVKPLEPLRVGTRIVQTGGTNGGGFGWQMRTFVRSAGDVVEAMESIGNLFQMGGGVSTTRVRYRRTSDGVVRYVESAKTSEPILIVPNTVRVGMEWTSGTDVLEVVKYRVLSREMKTTPVGDAIVWTIGRVTEVSVEERHEYAEGIGAITVNVNGLSLNPPSVDTMVVPDAEPTAAAALPTLTGRPIVIEPTVNTALDSLQIESLSAIQAPSGTLTLMVRGSKNQSHVGAAGTIYWVKGLEDECLAFDGTQIARNPARSTAQSNGPINRFETGTLEGCPLREFPSPGGADYPPYYRLRSDATGVTVRADGTALWTERYEDNTVWYGVRELWGGGGVGIGAFHIGAQDLLWMGSVNIQNDASGEGYGFIDLMSANPTGGSGSWANLGAFSIGTNPRNVADAGFWILPMSAELPAEPVPVWHVSRPGTLMRATLSQARTEGVVPLFHLVGDLSTRASSTTREVWVTHLTGEIAKLVTVAGEERVEQYGRLALGPNEQLVGAVRGLSDTQVVAMVRDRTNAVSTGGENFAGRAPFTGRARFYLVDIGSPMREAPVGSLGVSIVPSGADAYVCWGATSEPLVREGWTLGGRPARVVPADDGQPCALVLRDLTADAPSLEKVDSYLVHGPVPGAGMVSVVASNRAGRTFGVPNKDSLAYEQGLVWEEDRWGRNGFPLVDTVNGRDQFADLRGGAWFLRPSRTQAFARYVGATTADYLLDLSMRPVPDVRISARLASGGIIYHVFTVGMYGTDPGVFYKLTREGVSTRLADGVVNRTTNVLFDDGIACAWTVQVLNCNVPGAMPIQIGTGPMNIGIGPNPALLEDGSLLLYNPPALFDRTTRMLTRWATRALEQVIRANDGALWGVTSSVEGPGQIVRITTAGLTPVPITPPSWLHGADLAPLRVFPGNGLVTVLWQATGDQTGPLVSRHMM